MAFASHEVEVFTYKKIPKKVIRYIGPSPYVKDKSISFWLVTHSPFKLQLSLLLFFSVMPSMVQKQFGAIIVKSSIFVSFSNAPTSQTPIDPHQTREGL